MDQTAKKNPNPPDIQVYDGRVTNAEVKGDIDLFNDLHIKGVQAKQGFKRSSY